MVSTCLATSGVASRSVLKTASCAQILAIRLSEIRAGNFTRDVG